LCSRLLSEDIQIRTYKIIFLPVVLYGCETWPLTLREEYRLCLRTACWGEYLEKHELAGGWRKLHNEELHNFDSSPSIIRMVKSRGMRWGGVHLGFW
jgi:hypothetical protein